MIEAFVKACNRRVALFLRSSYIRFVIFVPLTWEPSNLFDVPAPKPTQDWEESWEVGARYVQNELLLTPA